MSIKASAAFSADTQRLGGRCLRALAVSTGLLLGMMVASFLVGFAAAAMGLGTAIPRRLVAFLAILVVVVAEFQVAALIWNAARRVLARRRRARPPG
jgi:hypothetical protein